MFKKITNLLILSLFISTFFVVHLASAEDCMHDPIYDRNWTAEVTTGVRVRSIPCMETSEVFTTIPVGDIVQVIAETDGYYQIKTANGTEGWVGQWLIGPTDKSFVEESQNTVVDQVTTNTTTELLPDIRGHKNEGAIWSLYYAGVINGHQDGYFRPDGTLNRAEMLKIVLEAKIQNFEQNRERYNNKCFDDIEAEQWYTHYVCYSKENHIINGYGDGTFRPEAPVSRAEAIKIILETFDYEIPEQSLVGSFTDIEPTQWFAGYLAIASQNGLLEENAGEFQPNMAMLRGAVSHVVNQTMKLQ